MSDVGDDLSLCSGFGFVEVFLDETCTWVLRVKLSVEAGLERGADGDSRTVPRHAVTLVTRQGAK